ncbi:MULTISPECIES: hypothetical protein [unclassified Chitinophaga]|uniref:hypothetical protein n=1 Tax=unclassified Chitinophaga TaxID=2619133 RepID=UPI0009D4EB66|nr:MULTISPECIES: hypothetical protein [unclassified Chitinophaga]OMP79254.1 hypothetical protein BW716_10365 [[Flexibacter] sp. ATCC 35208]WPV63791.1 hypothetical protein QQL36_18500 [Chitinophaga sp. LS1]
MKYFAWIIIIYLPFIASCQDKSKINIKAQYISLFLKDSTGNGYWKDIQKTPAGDFLCQEQGNGNLIIHFNRFDPQSEFINATKNYTDVIPKIQNDICGFRFKGIYYLESQPVDIAYAMYYDTKRPNSLVIVKYAGQTIIGANFHSDKQANPLKEANIRF